MKNNKKVVLALSAILIAAAIFVVSEKMSSVRPPEHRTRFFPTLEERHINAITVNDGNGILIRLNKRGDGDWTVDGGDTAFYSADSGLVQIALEKIVTLKKGEPVSVNPEKQAAFEVGDTGKSYVKVYKDKGETAGVLLVGKNGPDWNSNYARLAGSDTVYLIPGGLRQSLFFGIDRWKKKEEAVTPDSGADNNEAM
ncbi:MAG: DUF4340 domain-containing protein [Chitinispirillales bacterium]|jgi:hypothetical protein|nr:DUF4340 domain-containing protein [Chitinispirillales bacterium]